MDDNAIITEIRAGRTGDYALLVRKYHRNLLAFIYRLVRDPDLTEDIGQEVFLSAYKSLPGFDPEMGTPFVAWLYIIARNRCVGHLRSQRGVRHMLIDDYIHLADPEGDAEGALIRQEELQVLRTLLEQLPEPFRAMLIQSLKGVSLNEIAGLYGVPLSTVKSRLFRAREKIKELMKIYTGGVRDERRI